MRDKVVRRMFIPRRCLYRTVIAMLLVAVLAVGVFTGYGLFQGHVRQTIVRPWYEASVGVAFKNGKPSKFVDMSPFYFWISEPPHTEYFLLIQESRLDWFEPRPRHREGHPVGILWEMEIDKREPGTTDVPDVDLRAVRQFVFDHLPDLRHTLERLPPAAVVETGESRQWDEIQWLKLMLIRARRPALIAGLVWLGICAIVIWLSSKRRSVALGVCHRCGYDLSGLTDSVCPECGTHNAPENLTIPQPTAKPSRKPHPHIPDTHPPSKSPQ